MIAQDIRFLHAISEDSDQPGHLQMPRLIRVFAECLRHYVGFVT